MGFFPRHVFIYSFLEGSVCSAHAIKLFYNEGCFSVGSTHARKERSPLTHLWLQKSCWDVLKTDARKESSLDCLGSKKF